MAKARIAKLSILIFMMIVLFKVVETLELRFFDKEDFFKQLFKVIHVNNVIDGVFYVVV
jgi:hypothetical protein